MKISTLILLLATLFSVNLVSAQNVGKRMERRAKNRVESKANQKVDRTVDKAVDEVFDGLFGKKKKKTQKEEEAVPGEGSGNEDSEAYDEAEAERRSQEAIAKMMGTGAQEDWEPVKNDFPVSFDMVITSEQKKETTSTAIKYTFDTWLLGMQMQQGGKEGEMLLLLDNEEGTMTTVVEEDGKRQGYRMNRSVIPAGSFNSDSDDSKITATGNTKMIDGYFCREYLIENKDGTTNAWLTKEVQVDFRQFNSALFGPAAGKAKKQDNNMLQFQEYGVLLEGTTVSKDGKETTHVKVSNIKTGDQIDRSILELGDVEILGIGN